MGSNFSAAALVECWKQYTCAGCGSSFRYFFRRTVTGWGVSRGTAAQAAKRAALAARLMGVLPRPCPVCGRYQPDMVAAGRAKIHGWVLAGSACCLGGILVLGVFDWLAVYITSWAVGVTCGLAVLGHLAAEGYNPNRNPERNRRLAERLWPEELDLLQRGDGPGGGPRKRFRRSRWLFLAFPLLVLSPALALAPELLRLANGWPLNPGWGPPVAGPGDGVRMEFPGSFSSVRGYRKGSATAVVTNADELNLWEEKLPASTYTADWGDLIFAGSSNEDKNPGPLWVIITLPDDNALAHRTLEIDVQLRVTFPGLVSEHEYTNQVRDFRRVLELRLAAPRAGTRYADVAFGGILTGGCLVLIAGYWLWSLAQSLRKRAPRATVISREDEPDPDLPEWLQDARE